MSICPAMRFPACVTLVMLLLWTGEALARHGELPNRIPEAAPYNVDEAAVYSPPFEEKWVTVNTPTLCATCHTRIFQEWNGSMMANSWRDPGWRGAFLLLSRLTATDGNCDIPDPPDGTPKAQLNPFANADCSSTFNFGTTTQTTTGSGSLLDDFCARCHMPTNYVDQVPYELDLIESPLRPDHIIKRALSQSCAGCHQLLNNTEDKPSNSRS